MRNALTVLALMAASAIPAHKDVIHPLMSASNSEELTGEFLNGLSAKCPEGMKVVDAKHLFHDHMSYQDTFNAVAQTECR
jgi:hypothetical protein